MRDAEVVDGESWLLSLSVDAKERRNYAITPKSIAVRVIAVCPEPAPQARRTRPTAGPDVREMIWRGYEKRTTCMRGNPWIDSSFESVGGKVIQGLESVGPS